MSRVTVSEKASRQCLARTVNHRLLFRSDWCHLPDFDVPEPHRKAVILQKDVSTRRLTIAWEDVILAFREDRLELWRIAVIFQYLDAVQPVFACLPRTTMRAVFHSPTGLTALRVDDLPVVRCLLPNRCAAGQAISLPRAC
jgi:hypothetical protein